jgi:hypothetical protein
MSYIFGVDFDETLAYGSWPDAEKGKPNEKLIRYLIAARLNGHKVILYTMREGELLDDAVKWCKSHGLQFDAVNDNLPEMQEFYGNNPSKIFANFYIDDHNALCGLGKKLPRLSVNGTKKEKTKVRVV